MTMAEKKKSPFLCELLPLPVGIPLVMKSVLHPAQKYSPSDELLSQNLVAQCNQKAVVSIHSL